MITPNELYVLAQLIAKNVDAVTIGFACAMLIAATGLIAGLYLLEKYILVESIDE